MLRLILAAALPLAAVTPLAAQSDDFELPTPEEYAERAARAEASPLFRSHDAIKMTLTADIEWLVKERNDSIETEGTLTFIDADGSEVTKPVNVRARGNFRRNRTNCNFPPLRFNFPTGQMEGTVFEGQDRVKLVAPCQDGRDQYQNYIYDEYLAYRAFNLISPLSYRVRLVEITFVDTEGDYESRTKHGFLIEADDMMAERNRSTMIDATQFHPSLADGAYDVVVSLFNYMIANSDFSPVFFHNAVLVRAEAGAYRTVPYDFDWAGVVNARYAAPDPSLGIRNVRQRIFRGFCRPELQHQAALDAFGPTRDDIGALYEGFAALGFAQFTSDDARDAIEYYGDFYELLDDPRQFERRIVNECRSMDGG